MFFAYMGPPDLEPEFPVYDTFIYPTDTKLVPYKMELPCNWVQIVENAADPIHNAYLHAIASGPQFSPAFAVQPALDFDETPLGFLSMATRRVKDNVFIRSSDIIMPNVAQFTSGAPATPTRTVFNCPANRRAGSRRWTITIVSTSDWRISATPSAATARVRRASSA